MADLTVTQTLQENVGERERGVVSGVQHSLNMLMDMIKFALVIGVPSIAHFGYLVIASFCFIWVACALFSYHAITFPRRKYAHAATTTPSTGEPDLTQPVVTVVNSNETNDVTEDDVFIT